MNPERLIQESGADVFVGSEIVQSIGLELGDFNLPERFNKLKEVISHFKDQPDYKYQIHKLTAGKPVNRLNHVHEYVQLANKKVALQEDMNKLNSEMELYG